MKKSVRYVLGAAAAGVLLMATAAPSSADVIVRVGPPALRAEVVPVAPGPGWAWRSGYWRWNGHRYVWVSGHYLRRPRVGAEWVPGHWGERGGGWVWIGGHWR